MDLFLLFDKFKNHIVGIVFILFIMFFKGIFYG